MYRIERITVEGQDVKLHIGTRRKHGVAYIENVIVPKAVEQCLETMKRYGTDKTKKIANHIFFDETEFGELVAIPLVGKKTKGDITKKGYKFCYVYNFACTEFSEMGDIYVDHMTNRDGASEGIFRVF